jgi:hypothetical protein
MLKVVYNILIGWGKKLKIIDTTPAEQKLSDLRLKICSECELSKESKTLKFINGEAVNESGLKCTVCKCPCIQKTLVVGESCPVNKW